MKLPSIILIIIIAAIGHAQEKRLITFDDLYDYPQIVTLSLSSDNKHIVCEVKDYVLTNDSYSSNLWLVSVDGRAAFQFTYGGTDASPAWSPDGITIAFISERASDENESGSAQIWLIPSSGGEARPLTNISTEADVPVWSADGQMMLFQSSVYPDCPDDDCNRKRDQEKEDAAVKALLYDDLLFRHYKYWGDGKRNHIFIIETDTGEYRDLTPFDKDAPPLALGGWPDYCFSSDGNEIAFVMNTDTVIAVSTNNDVFSLNINTNQLTRISDGQGNDHSPSYSPDSRYLAYKSMARAGFESDKNNLILFDRASKTHENITSTFNRSIDDYIWGPYSKYIYFTAIDQGLRKICQLNIKSGKIKILVDDGVCSDIQISSNGIYLYYSKSTPTQPYEVYEYNTKHGRQTQLSHFSDSLFSRLQLSPAEDFRFEGANGDSIHGILTLPPDFDEAGKYPLALLIHGGPQWCWLKDFNYYGWNTQFLAAQGYVVAQIDPHGSRGYGQVFVDAVTNDWGGAPYEDLMLGLDYL